MHFPQYQPLRRLNRRMPVNALGYGCVGFRRRAILVFELGVCIFHSIQRLPLVRGSLSRNILGVADICTRESQKRGVYRGGPDQSITKSCRVLLMGGPESTTDHTNGSSSKSVWPELIENGRFIIDPGRRHEAWESGVVALGHRFQPRGRQGSLARRERQKDMESRTRVELVGVGGNIAIDSHLSKITGEERVKGR